MEELLEMSSKELDRYRILCAVKNKQISQVKASELLGLSTRQIRNLLYAFNKDGPKGLISKKRGRSNRGYHSQFKRDILTLIQEHYEDFGPTLISEKLKEKHQITLSNETLRSWMAEINIWIPKQRKRKRHFLRNRRECFGELIQMDGSHHDWFEGRSPPCVLIVFIDDATSKITSLYFTKEETLDAYFNALEIHLKAYGRPKQTYSDRFAVFQSRKGIEALTHFKYALKLLEISHITAKTPQAKGRVERAHKTLQDRLIKEMRLKNISTIDEANQFCEEYIRMHNEKFSKEPANTFDAHRPLETDLSRILCRYEERTLTNDLSIYFHNKIYQICEDLEFPKNAKIEVRKQRNGKLRFFFKNQELTYLPFDEIAFKPEIKELVWPIKENSSKKLNHPWKGPTFKSRLKQEEIRRVI